MVGPTTGGACDPAQVGYEELRGLAIAGAAFGGGRGLVVLLREGLAAWVARRCTGADPVKTAVQSDHRAGVPAVSDDVHAGVVRVLASIALGRWRKEMNA
jgi:hypothetical protein